MEAFSYFSKIPLNKYFRGVFSQIRLRHDILHALFAKTQKRSPLILHEERELQVLQGVLEKDIDMFYKGKRIDDSSKVVSLYLSPKVFFFNLKEEYLKKHLRAFDLPNVSYDLNIYVLYIYVNSFIQIKVFFI